MGAHDIQLVVAYYHVLHAETFALMLHSVFFLVHDLDPHVWECRVGTILLCLTASFLLRPDNIHRDRARLPLQDPASDRGQVVDIEGPSVRKAELLTFFRVEVVLCTYTRKR